MKIRISLKHFTKNISSPYNHMSQWVNKLSIHIKTVADLTTNIGAESIYFAIDKHRFPLIKRIDSFEIDKNTYDLLLENLEYTHTLGKIFPHNTNSIRYILHNKLKADLFLLDPPWTGSEYKQGKQEIFDEYRHKLFLKEQCEIPLDTITLTIDDKPLVRVINDLKPYFKYLVLKIPLNEVNAPTSKGYKNQLENFKQEFIYIEAFEQIKYVVIIISQNN